MLATCWLQLTLIGMGGSPLVAGSPSYVFP